MLLLLLLLLLLLVLVLLLLLFRQAWRLILSRGWLLAAPRARK